MIRGGQKKSLFEVERFYCYKKCYIKRNRHKLKGDMKEIKRQKKKTATDQDEEMSTMAQAVESEMIDILMCYMR